MLFLFFVFCLFDVWLKDVYSVAFIYIYRYIYKTCETTSFGSRCFVPLDSNPMLDMEHLYLVPNAYLCAL